MAILVYFSADFGSHSTKIGVFLNQIHHPQIDIISPGNRQPESSKVTVWI